MFGPVKYIAESRFPVPMVVGRDAAMYAVPGLLPSKVLVPGSIMMVSTAFRGCPSSTGPADCPWNVCSVIPNDNCRGQNVVEQQPFRQRWVTIGIGTTC